MVTNSFFKCAFFYYLEKCGSIFLSAKVSRKNQTVFPSSNTSPTATFAAHIEMPCMSV